jgi:hypothetical protein
MFKFPFQNFEHGSKILIFFSFKDLIVVSKELWILFKNFLSSFLVSVVLSFCLLFCFFFSFFVQIQKHSNFKIVQIWKNKNWLYSKSFKFKIGSYLETCSNILQNQNFEKKLKNEFSKILQIRKIFNLQNVQIEKYFKKPKNVFSKKCSIPKK